MGIKHSIHKYIWKIKRKVRQILRLFGLYGKDNTCNFSMVVVKRLPYVNMAIGNINSLHYQNHRHNIEIYADSLCANELRHLKNKFDYPQQVIVTDEFSDGAKPWQYYKIEAIIKSAKKNQILIDADGIWHQDPIVDRNKITFQVSPLKVKEKKEEFEVVKKIFNKPEWGEFRYYTSAFVSIPSKHMSADVEEKTREYLNILFNHGYDFLDSQEERDQQKRQSEQFAINLALLTAYPAELFSVLKTEDGPKNKDFVQPLYYGTTNKIIE